MSSRCHTWPQTLESEALDGDDKFPEACLTFSEQQGRPGFDPTDTQDGASVPARADQRERVTLFLNWKDSICTEYKVRKEVKCKRCGKK